MDLEPASPTCAIEYMDDEEGQEHEVTASGHVRPSYMELLEDNSSPKEDFDEAVVKNLSAELRAEEKPDKEVIKTFLRIRPPDSAASQERKSNENLYEIDSPTTLLVKQPTDSKKLRSGETKFTFSGILSENESQQIVFEKTVLPLLTKFMEGENCLIFSYGATNSGKTYTMQGYDRNFGIIPRTLEYCFKRMEGCLYTRGDLRPNQFDGHTSMTGLEYKKLEEFKHKLLREIKTKHFDPASLRESCVGLSCQSVANETFRSKMTGLFADGNDVYDQGPLFSIWVSFAEIYNDRVYDLFEIVQKGAKRRELKLYQDAQGRVYINDLTEFNVKNVAEAYQLFLVGRTTLQFATTNMNHNSSRSHSFFSIRLISLGIKGGFVYPLKVFRLSFCDLAGVERIGQTGNVGLRLKESGNINQSLLVLLRCIRALRDKQEGKLSSDVVPYRDSKLSRLFKSFLTASTHIRMLVTINPDPLMADCTFQVLMNAAVASKVQLIKRVEAPVHNTNFCRRVRDSMGLPRIATSEESESDDDESDYTSAEESIDFIPSVPTVKRATARKVPLAPVVVSSRVDILEKENRELREELRNQREKLHDEIHEKFMAIYNEQETFYKNLLDEHVKTNEEVNKRRLSLAKHCFREYPEAILNVSGSSFEAVVTKIPKNAPKSKQAELRAAHEAQVVKVKAGIHGAEIFEEANEYKVKFEELSAQNGEVQKLLQENEETIRSLRTELLNVMEERDQEELKKKNLESILKVLHEENEKVVLEHKKQRYTMLGDELAKERELVKLKEKELADATKLCQGYHTALEEANLSAQETQDKCAKLELELMKMKEEEEFLHLTVDDLEEKIIKLEQRCEDYSKRIRESDSESSASTSQVEARSSRPRRKGASYRTKTSASPK